MSTIFIGIKWHFLLFYGLWLDKEFENYTQTNIYYGDYDSEANASLCVFYELFLFVLGFCNLLLYYC